MKSNNINVARVLEINTIQISLGESQEKRLGEGWITRNRKS